MRNLLLIPVMNFLICEANYSQLKLEVDAGYISSLNKENIFSHTKDGIQGSLTLLFPSSDLTNLTGRIVYQSRHFDKNSFSFIVPLVLGNSVPVVTDGDNLKSFGLMIGARVLSGNKQNVSAFASAEAGLIYHSVSYYELNNQFKYKYAGDKTFFEYSFGLGMSFGVNENYSVNIEGKMSHIPAEGLVYFPINLGFMFPF
ncbi:MAG: hypothetical protein HRF52_13040 [Ignavibacterium sp.]|jgi:hypothetical protein|uniref:hypothetical protein n=1 Tax=Ignavibacterium sp. TaxID=2651167 RepID=UPI003299F38D